MSISILRLNVGEIEPEICDYPICKAHSLLLEVVCKLCIHVAVLMMEYCWECAVTID
jgi:hypothetical protein